MTELGFWLVAVESRYTKGTPGRTSRLKMGKSARMLDMFNEAGLVGAEFIRLLCIF